MERGNEVRLWPHAAGFSTLAEKVPGLFPNCIFGVRVEGQ